MFCLLMVNQNFEIIEVAFAVIAPGPGEDLFDIRMMTLLLGHDEVRGGLLERDVDLVGKRSDHKDTQNKRFVYQ